MVNVYVMCSGVQCALAVGVLLLLDDMEVFFRLSGVLCTYI